MLSDKNIKYEQGEYWILETWKSYTVMRDVGTHSVSDSEYNKDADGLSIAIARCNYLAMKEKKI